MPEAVATRPQPSPAALALADVIGDPGKLAYRRKVLDALGQALGTTNHGVRSVELVVEGVAIGCDAVVVEGHGYDYTGAPSYHPQQPIIPDFEPRPFKFSETFPVPFTDGGLPEAYPNEPGFWLAVYEHLYLTGDTYLWAPAADCVAWGDDL